MSRNSSRNYSLISREPAWVNLARVIVIFLLRWGRRRDQEKYYEAVTSLQFHGIVLISIF